MVRFRLPVSEEEGEDMTSSYQVLVVKPKATFTARASVPTETAE